MLQGKNAPLKASAKSPFKTDGTPYQDSDGDPGQQAHYLLFYDELTGLYNRRFYNRAYAEQTERAVAETISLALILIDVDLFKSINDRYGHQQGDNILSGVGRVISETVGTEGYPIRYAGDEFVILLPEVTVERAQEIADALATRARTEEFKLLNTRRTLQVTFSIGVSHYPANTEQPEKLFENADHAAYIAKRNGRDRVVAYQTGVKYVLDRSTLYHYFPCPELVARGGLVEALVEALSQSTRERVPWTFLSGPGGVGKTRLLAEFRARVDKQRHVLLQAAGLPSRLSQPFGLLLDALGARIREQPQEGQLMASTLNAIEIGVISKLLPDLSRYALMVESGPGLDEEDDDSDPYLEAFCKMLQALSEGRAPCIIFDDFQWADQGTMKVLELLRERDPRTFVCVAMRNDAEVKERNPVLGSFLEHITEGGSAAVQELGELGADDVREMIVTILPDAAQFDDLIALVSERSHGMPLIVEEVLKYLIHQRCIYYTEGKMIVELEAEKIPTSADKLMSERTEQVDLDIRQLMSRAAVIGQDFDFSSLMLLEGRDEGYLRGIVERARKAHIISEVWSDDTDHISFISAQTHLAFYNALDEEDRRKLHFKLARLRQRQYANTLDSALSELAYHFSRAGESDRASQYLKIITELYGQYASTEVVVIGRSEDVSDFSEGELPEELLTMGVDVARSFKLTVQNMRMYGSEHVRKKGGFDEIVDRMNQFLENLSQLTLAEADGQLLINGTPLGAQLAHGNAVLDLFRMADVKGLTFRRGVNAGELRACLDFICLGRDEIRSRGGLEGLFRQVSVVNIVPNAKVYVAIGERDILVKKNASGQEMLIKQAEGAASDLDASDKTTMIRGKTTSPGVEEDLRRQIDELKDLLRKAESAPRATAPAMPSVGAVLAAAEAQRTATLPQDVVDFRKEVQRYIDADFLDTLKRDWSVLQSDLESASDVKIAAASKMYVEAEEQAVEPLLRVLSTTRDERARRIAASLLKKVSATAADRILFALHASVQADDKMNLIAALDGFDDAGIAARLEGLVRDDSPEVRRAALDAIGRLAQGTLEKCLPGILPDAPQDVRLDVVSSMGEHRITLAVEPLSKMAKRTTWLFFERNQKLQARACHALGKIGDPRAIPTLLGAMAPADMLYRAKSSPVRAAAIIALSLIPQSRGDARVQKALERATRDRDTLIRSSARMALDRLSRQSGATEPDAAAVF